MTNSRNRLPLKIILFILLIGLLSVINLHGFSQEIEKETSYTYLLSPNEIATNETEFLIRGIEQRATLRTYDNTKEKFNIKTSEEINMTKAVNPGLYHNTDNSAFNQVHPKPLYIPSDV